ncbi:MAG TPA: phosphatase PAP2 family protein [Chitinophagales bacterium]|nr:phosphatase PAP2 family protein [Chitinophagales bacterium]
MNISSRNFFILLLSFVCLSVSCFSQLIDLGLRDWKTSIETPYNLKKKIDIPVCIGAVALIGGGFVLKTFKTPLTDEELAHPDTSKIPSFDLSAIHQANPSYQKASDILEITAMALPFIAYVDKRVSGHGSQIVAIYLETLAIDFAAYNVTTGIVNRHRPLTYNTDTTEVPLKTRKGPSVKESFFSGHTCNAATATFCGAKIFTDLRPHSKLVPFVWIAAAGVPAFTAYSRYKAGKHFPSDVIVGYIVGASIGYFVPQLHKYATPDKLSLAPAFDEKGLVMTYTF